MQGRPLWPPDGFDMLFKFVSACVVIGLVGCAALMAQTTTPSGEGLPDGPGKDVTVRTCGVCHEARRAASLRLSRDGWASVIDDMVRRGAKASDDDRQTILDYLSTNFLGEAPRPLNVNTATQIDLESVLELLRREAAAIVAYRDKHGAFKTVEDLKKVPGLDYKKIAGKRERIVCY
jgi:competence protein ComEA